MYLPTVYVVVVCRVIIIPRSMVTSDKIIEFRFFTQNCFPDLLLSLSLSLSLSFSLIISSAENCCSLHCNEKYLKDGRWVRSSVFVTLLASLICKIGQLLLLLLFKKLANGCQKINCAMHTLLCTLWNTFKCGLEPWSNGPKGRD